MKDYLFKAVTLMASFVVTSVQAGPIYTAIQTPYGTVGNQQFLSFQSQTSGDDFNVNSPIEVYSLGAFDSGSDGINGTLVVRIYDRNSKQSLANISFSGTAGTLSGGIRFLNLTTPLILPAGFQGTISAACLGNPLEADGNFRDPSPPTWTSDSGAGAISFVGEGRHSSSGTGDVFPNVVDASTSPINFLIASFTFSSVPEPESYKFLAMAAGWLIYVTYVRKPRFNHK